MKAYVLCGGFGTRLRPAIKDNQKAMAEVHGQPFLLMVLKQLGLAGVTEAVLCAHYRAEQIAENIELLQRQSRVSLTLLIEQEPLGTGGAILHALKKVPAAGDFLVVNADTYIEAAGYHQLIKEGSNALLCRYVTDRSRYGSLLIDNTKNLLAIQEKGEQGRGLINAGVYCFSEKIFNDQDVGVCSIEQELLPRVLREQSIKAVEYTGMFVDIGTPESYYKFVEQFGNGGVL